jgi:hypothetical protein
VEREKKMKHIGIYTDSQVENKGDNAWAKARSIPSNKKSMNVDNPDIKEVYNDF